MAVDDVDLLIVVRVGMQVAQLIVRAIRIAGVVHAGAEISVIEIRVLMIEAEGMADFLAHHELAPRRSVVLARIEVRVVDFDRPLYDVTATSDPDLRDAQPPRTS